MGGTPSSPLGSSQPRESAEFLIGILVGDKSYPLSSSMWQKILELPLTLVWPQDKINSACSMLAQNNSQTRHLAKILVHLVRSLQDCQAEFSSTSISKAINAAHLSSLFLKYLIENAKIHKFEDLYLDIDDADSKPDNGLKDKGIPYFVMSGVLSFIGNSDVSPQSCLVHFELLNFVLVALSTQLRSSPTPGQDDAHPFIDAAMAQDDALTCSMVQRLMKNYISRASISLNGSNYSKLGKETQLGPLQRLGSAAANFVLLPYYTFNYLVNSSADVSKVPLADNSLLVLLILIHYRRCMPLDESLKNHITSDVALGLPSRESSNFYLNPYSKLLENARDVEFDRVDIEGNALAGSLVRLPFASLFDTLGTCLSDESSVLLLYSLVYGNSNFLEYVFVRTDLDTLLMPILETLYNASKKTSNQIYMLLIILLVLSQDSSFNASIHKLVLPTVPWYRERLLHNTSLGSLMVVILIRTVKYNMSKLRDIYLHTNCLATLANMAPHVHRLSGYASQSIVSLFDMLGRKYTKLVESKQDKSPDLREDDVSAELQIYTDFLRIVLEILNAILTYALPRNPEVVYAIMHRQEVFQPFRNHSRFNELLENIYTVLDFFNSRMDTRPIDGEWSVDKVLQVIIMNCRFWHGEGMKMFNQLKFTYEQESHHEEFFIPYIWQLVLSTSGFTFNRSSIRLFQTDGEVNQ